MDKFKLFDDLREQKTRSGEISHANPGSAFNHADIAVNRKLIDSKTLDSIIGLSASSRYRYINRTYAATMDTDGLRSSCRK